MGKIEGLTICEGICIGRVLLYSPGQKISTHSDGEPVILAANELTPIDMLEIEKLVPAGFITAIGTIHSHVSILIRNMDVPAITNIPVQSDWNGKQVIVDADRGEVIVDPTAEMLPYYEEQIKLAELRKEKLLDEYRNRNAITRRGKKLNVYANITSLSDLPTVLEQNAEGIGVFKTEFLYMKAAHIPTEDEQFEVNRKLVTAMGNKKVVIRTVDLGADKKAACFYLDEEENPAMGYRGIRICLKQPEIFLPQIKAILRASAFGKVAIMYPMIISANEILAIQKIVNQAKRELRNQGIAFDDKIEQGIMIETPAAVMISTELAQMVDFFSIGTNDLLQYLFAVDRQSPKLKDLLDPYHPAFIRAIHHVMQSAKKAGIWVGVSGELASDLAYLHLFVDDGIDALAVSPSRILKVKQTICEMEQGTTSVLRSSDPFGNTLEGVQV